MLNEQKEVIPPSIETKNKNKPCYCFNAPGEFMKNPLICSMCGFQRNWSNITANNTEINSNNIKSGTTKIDYEGCYQVEITRIKNKYLEDEEMRENDSAKTFDKNYNFL